MTIYDTPKTNLETKPEDYFKGWLKLFYIINIIWLTFLPLGVLVYSSTALINSEVSLLNKEVLFYILEVSPDFIFSILILKLIKSKNIETPEKIKKLIAFELVTKLAIGLIIYICYKNGITEDKPSPIIISIIYFLIWSNYFKR